MLNWSLMALRGRQRASAGCAQWLGLVARLGLVGLVSGCRAHMVTPTKVVASFTRQLTLTGKAVPVDFYLPADVKSAPVVVVAHGFTRSRLNMAGWGGLLASNGFIVAIPDLPTLADRDQNGRAIVELLEVMNREGLTAQPKPTGGAALIGFSMGGLSTLLAAASNGNVRCWIGLDPVESGRRGAQAAASLAIPCAVLRAEPAAWNLRGNVRRLTQALPGPFLTLCVRGATHSDPEAPTDGLAELLCGKSNPQRHGTFERYTVATLRAVFFGDHNAQAALAGAVCDPAVEQVASRGLEGFAAQSGRY